MARAKTTLIAAAVLLAAAGSAGAVSLQQAYEAALKNDPQFRMSYYEHESSQENIVLGRSNLLPQVSASYSASRNVADLQYTNPPNTPELHPRYISRSSSVQLRQPILNLDGVMRYREGKVQAKLGDQQFASSRNDVIVRVVSAYADALFAEDQLALSRVQRDMYAEQQKVNDRLFQKGEGTRTDMLETKARLDLAEAQVIEAQDNATATRNTLAGVIGMEPGQLDHLADGFHFQDLTPGSYDAWRDLALQNNPELAAARLAIETARLEVLRNRAGHAPRVDFVASYSKGDAESLNTYTQNTVNRTIGVQVNIPIYQGGAINATTRQAAFAYERSKADLDVRSNKVLLDLRKSFDQAHSSVGRINALEQAVASSKELMKATEQSIKGGVRINLDLLNAQQQLYTSQRDLAQARYTYLLSLLRLRAASGTLDDAAVREVAAYFR